MVEERILLLALRGRDALVIAQLLAAQGHATLECPSARTLAQELEVGAGSALITEESLVGTDCAAIEQWVAGQEPWSDFPFVLLATKRTGKRPKDAARLLEQLGNVIMLERPIHRDTLGSAVAAALRMRRRQYEGRSRLLALKAAEERLIQLNETLEARIGERTEALSRANNQLMQEIAERERAQAALLQAQKMDAVGQLTGGIAHDFNNLLTAVSGNLELIQRRADDKRILRYADLAMEASERAAKLTHKLLAFSRYEQLALAPVNINALVEGMTNLLERTIGPQIEKRLQLDPAEPWVMADRQQLELAVLNLAINARDAMPRGGALTISTAVERRAPEGLTEETYGTIRVSDTGVGISPALLPKVFDPFFTTKPIGKGTGLGLSQVFGIAKQSAGTVQIESSEGAGTSVTIWLPVAEPVTADVGSSAPYYHCRNGQGGSVMVVDDDDGVRTFVAECLELLGYVPIGMANGQEALARIGTDQPDILIVDFAMPGMNGLDVARAAHKLRPAMPIILATGYAEIESNPASKVLSGTLRKPFKVEDLARAIRRATSSQMPQEGMPS